MRFSLLVVVCAAAIAASMAPALASALDLDLGYEKGVWNNIENMYCANGFLLRTKAGAPAVSSTVCGAETSSILATIKDDKTLTASIQKCCKVHRTSYGVCDSKKTDADEAFRACVGKAGENNRSAGGLSESLFAVVQRNGTAIYQASQTARCECYNEVTKKTGKLMPWLIEIDDAKVAAAKKAAAAAAAAAKNKPLAKGAAVQTKTKAQVAAAKTSAKTATKAAPAVKATVAAKPAAAKTAAAAKAPAAAKVAAKAPAKVAAKAPVKNATKSKLF